MKIGCSCININFRDNKKNNFGYDDIISEARRDYIRNHIYDNVMPNYSILEKNGRLEEFEINKLISGLLGKKVDKYSLSKILAVKNKNVVSVDEATMENLPLYNVTKIMTTESYRGSSPAERLSSLHILKNAGIQRIVDLAGYEYLESHCKKLGLEYYNFDIDFNIWSNAIFKNKNEIIKRQNRMGELFGYSKEEIKLAREKAVSNWEENKQKFLEKFIPFIKIMQKDNVYIGCEFGTYTTDNALLLNHFFNPKAQRTKNCITSSNRHQLSKLINLFNNLTENHKNELDWNKEFSQKLFNKLMKLSK